MNIKNMKGTIYIIISCILYAGSGILIRFVNKELTLFSQIYYRVIISLIITLIFVLITHKKLSFERKDLHLFILSAGIGYVAMITFFSIGILNTTIGNTYWLLYTTPLFVILLSRLFFKEKLQSKYIIAFIILAAGMYLLFKPALNNTYGDIAAIASAVCYAVYIMINKQLSKKYDAGESLLYTLGLSVLLLTLSIPFFHNQISLSFGLGTGLFIVLFGVNNFIATYLLNLGLKYTSAQNASILLVFEPIFSIVYSWLFFGEKLTLIYYVGFALIFFAVYISSQNCNIHMKLESKKNHQYRTYTLKVNNKNSVIK